MNDPNINTPKLETPIPVLSAIFEINGGAALAEMANMERVKKSKIIYIFILMTIFFTSDLSAPDLMHGIWISSG